MSVRLAAELWASLLMRILHKYVAGVKNAYCYLYKVNWITVASGNDIRSALVYTDKGRLWALTWSFRFIGPPCII